MVTAPAVIPRLDPDVVKIVLPVGLPLVFWTVKSPESVSGFVAIVYVRPATSVASNVTWTNPLPVEAAMVIVPPAWVTLPLTETSYAPTAIVPLKPLVFKDAIETFPLIVTEAEAELPSKKTGFVGPGTEQPKLPPEEDAQWFESFQLPLPWTQYRLPAHGAAMPTCMSGSEPSIVKTTCPAPLTVPLAKGNPSFVTLNRFPTAFPPIVHVMV